MGYQTRIGGLDVRCDSFTELEPLVARESERLTEVATTLSDCITAIDMCMIEMSRNGDSVTVREKADAARARAQKLLGRPVTR